MSKHILSRYRDDAPGAQQRRQSGARPARKPLRPDPEGGKKRGGGQGLPEIFDPAAGPERVAEDGAGPQSAGDAGNREEDPWWLDPKDPHRATYVRQGLFGPTVPTFWTSNPAY